MTKIIEKFFSSCVLFTWVVWAQPVPFVNGSFEDGPVPGSFKNLPGGTSTVKGWVVTGEGIDYIGGLWRPTNGSRSFDLDGSATSRITPPYAQGGIAQTFATKAGTRYQVTFDLAGNPFSPPALKRMRISAADEQKEFTFDTTGKTATNMGWRSETWTFTAKAATTTLEFRSLMVPRQTGWGPAIDNVAVTALAATQPLQVTETINEIDVRLDAAILFDSGKYDLKPAATNALRELATLLGKYPTYPVIIEGHTDNVGKPNANQTLSENRAASVKAWLAKNASIGATRMTTKGYGETKPIASNNTEAGRQQNRRVEIRIQKILSR